MPSLIKPLPSLPFLRRRRCRRRLHLPRSFSVEAGDPLLLKISALLKRLSSDDDGGHTPPLETGARPDRPHPFDYARLITAFGRAGEPDEALRLLREMRRDFGMRPDVVCYTAVVDSLVAAHRVGEAVELFEEMPLMGVAPDTAAYTVLVKLYAWHLEDFDTAYEVLRLMAECGCSPDVVTYSTMIAGLCRAGRVEEALGVLDQMLEVECQPNAHTCTPIVQAYCARGKTAEAKRLVDTMEAMGCQPNTVTYNVLIDALCKSGALREVEMLLESSGSKGWQPDTITYTTYMDGLCKHGRAEESFKQLEAMLDRGLRPNAITLNILLDGLCHGSNVMQAKCLLERSADLEWSASVVNYNTVMSKLSNEGTWLDVMKLFADMFKKGISPNSWTFSIVIHSLSKARKMCLALHVFSSKGFVANVMSCTTLIRYLYASDRPREVPLVFQKMFQENIAPTEVTYSVLITCLCEERMFLEAIGCFHRTLGEGYSTELAANLIYRLVKGGRIRDLLILLEWMMREGMRIDVSIFHQLIKAFCRSGYCKNPNILWHILDRMLQQDQCSKLPCTISD